MNKQMISPYFKAVSLGIAMAIVILFLLAHHVASVVKIEGSSMNPALRDQERIIILKAGIPESTIRRFDIVVFSVPGEKGKKFIKRIIGLPGEKIEINRGRVFINDRELDFTAHLSRPLSLSFLSRMKPVTIPKNYYFVIGDNLGVSLDSRVLGLIPVWRIIGKAVLRYWPLSRLGTIS